MFYGKTTSFNLVGKWGRKDSEPYPLIFHLFDAAAVTLALWKSSFGPHSRRSFATALGISEDKANRLLAFWVALHDLGKASPAFQVNNDATRKCLEQEGFVFPRRISPANRTYHNFVTAKTLKAVLSDEPWNLCDQLARNIATAVGGHHGSFAQADNLTNLPDDEVGDGRWDKTRREIVAALAGILGVDELTWTPPGGLAADYPFFIQLAGLTSVCDWLASDEDYFFPGGNSPAGPDEHLDWSCKQAEKVVADALRWRRWENPSVPKAFADAFPHLNIKTPFPLQEKAADIAETLDGPALVVVEAPMGEGKTEAALYLADRWLREPGAEGFYVALPTMATSNQMYGRVKDFLNARLKGEGVNVHLLHSGAALVKDYAELKLAIESGDEPAEDASVIAAEWFTSKKRGLISPFGVGTVDQALMAVLQVRHVFVRLFGLAHKAVVVDEVHAYDAYMSVLLERLLAWLGALGAPVILLSATLPREKRLALLRAYGAEPREDNVPYPRITVARPGEPAVVYRVEGAPRRRTEVAVMEVPTDAAAVAARLADALAGGGCAAVICNTVARAQAMYVAVKERFGGDCLLVHARFPAAARKEREDRAEKMFGKPGLETERPPKFVLVGTQVLEQSLDLDFDLMVTDLAPADLVLQRMGRLHRHQRDPRPEGLDKPTLWLIWPPAGEDGVPDFGPSVYVYDHYILLRSWLALGKRLDRIIRVPDDLEKIVEEVYGEGEPAPVEGIGEALEKAYNDFVVKRMDFRASAQQKAIPFPDEEDLFEDIRGLLEDEENPKVSRALQGLTRLAKNPSITVVCLAKEGEIYVPAITGGIRIDLGSKERPDDSVRKALLGASLSLSDGRVAWFLLDELRNGRGTPPGWKKDPYLRYAYRVIFENGVARIGKYKVKLDAETGFEIEDECKHDATYGEEEK